VSVLPLNVILELPTKTENAPSRSIRLLGSPQYALVPETLPLSTPDFMRKRAVSALQNFAVMMPSSNVEYRQRM